MKERGRDQCRVKLEHLSHAAIAPQFISAKKQLAGGINRCGQALRTTLDCRGPKAALYRRVRHPDDHARLQKAMGVGPRESGGNLMVASPVIAEWTINNRREKVSALYREGALAASRDDFRAVLLACWESHVGRAAGTGTGFAAFIRDMPEAERDHHSA
jgi:hypothetical protein